MVSSLTIYETLRHSGVPDDQAKAHTKAIEAALEQNNSEQSKILATKLDVEKSTRTVITTIFGFLIGFAALILAGVYFLINQSS
jgi:hypothetical protein